MSSIFLKLVNLSISAAWLILAVLILRLITKKAPKWIHCMMWAVAALRLICPFSPKSILSLIPSAETIPMDITMAEKPAIQSGIPVINTVVNEALADNLYAEAQMSANPMQIWVSVLTVLWIVGIAVFLLYAIISYVSLYRRVQIRVRVGRGVYICDKIDTPFILGIICPHIYLTSTLDQQQTRYVLAHERAHIARKDHWWKALGYALLSLYWFQPMVWIAYVCMCRDVELACDERVIASMDDHDRKEYSRTILNCSVQGRNFSACPLAFGEVGVKERVKSVLNYKKPAFWIPLLSILLCIGVAVGFLTYPKDKDLNEAAELSPESSISEITQQDQQDTAPESPPQTTEPEEVEEKTVITIDCDPFVPEDIHNLVKAEVHETFGDFVVEDPQDLTWMQEHFGSAVEEKGIGCPVGMKLYLTRSDGVTGYVMPAMDSCDVFCVNDVYYDYGAGDNEILFEMLGIRPVFYTCETVNTQQGRTVSTSEWFWYQENSTTVCSYDQQNRLLSSIQTYCNGDKGTCMHYEYDEEGCCVKAVCEDLYTLDYQYDLQEKSLYSVIRTESDGGFINEFLFDDSSLEKADVMAVASEGMKQIPDEEKTGITDTSHPIITRVSPPAEGSFVKFESYHQAPHYENAIMYSVSYDRAGENGTLTIFLDNYSNAYGYRTES